MENSISQRVKIYCKFKSIKISAFEKRCGLSNGYVNGITRGIGESKLKTISLNFPDLNVSWLLTGEGEMLKTNISIGGDNIVQTIEGDNHGTMIGKGKYSGKFAGIPEGSQMQYLMEQNKQLLQQNQKFQEHIDRLLGIIEDMNRGK